MTQHGDITYDYVVAGSGIAGLICACYLSMQGQKVIVLEKNHQIGGALQVFSRDKKIFDTGVHYIGSLGAGETLHNLYGFLGIIDYLNFAPLEQRGFDRVIFSGDKTEYFLSQGWNNFYLDLIKYFPNEAEGIDKLISKIKQTVALFGPYFLRPLDDGGIAIEVLSEKLSSVFNQLSFSDKLIAVLTGNSILYGYAKAKTPFYVFALILNSYVTGAYRMIKGGSQIAKALSRRINQLGGTIIKYAEVTSFNYEDGRIIDCTIKGKGSIHGKNFISNFHPKCTTDMLHPNPLRSGYLLRLDSLQNTTSFVTVHLSLEQDKVPYFNYNKYIINDGCIAGKIQDQIDASWPQHFLLCTGREWVKQEFASTLTVLAFANFSQFDPWNESANTVSTPAERGESYAKFKNGIIAQVLQQLDEHYPGIAGWVRHKECSTPLTIRDFLGQPSGAAYGYEKDANDILRCMISPATKIDNLFLTGQNTDLHGIYGASISALLTLERTPHGGQIWQDIRTSLEQVS